MHAVTEYFHHGNTIRDCLIKTKLDISRGKVCLHTANRKESYSVF